MLVRMKRGPKHKPRRERFYERVDRGTGDGCWIWTGAINQRRGGYGYFYDDDTRLRRAHRVAWELEHGPLPEDVALMHTCDNPACVRVSHLVPGDQAANLADMRQKGRGFVPPPERGTERYNATLTDDVVRRLRRAYDSGKPIAPLARELGVRQSTAQRAATRQSWKHVTD